MIVPTTMRCLGAVLACLALTATASAQNKPPRFQLTFDPAITSNKPFTGRVFLLASKKPVQDLPGSIRWLNPDPFFAMDVTGWKPGEALTYSANPLGFPYALDKLPAGKYYIQAVMDLDQGGSFNCITSPGNGYSKARAIEIGPGNDNGAAATGDYSLLIDQIYPEPTFKETARIKLVDIESKLVSKFQGKPVRMQAAVMLPRSYNDNKDRKYPVIYAIPGFSGTHFSISRVASRNPTDVAGVDMIYVMLNPSCSLGHHVFADSDNNGPYGQALLQELIPEIETRFRALGEPRGRFLTGHSSGGWSSLWLQVTYPDFFGGTWSTGPDPVDFRDFQMVNIYQPGVNLLFDAKGLQRPLGRKNGKVILHYKPFSDMERVMGRGGQLFSFEAVFSPRASNGKPAEMWNRDTGAVHADIAKTWERYDIRRILERNWKTLGPKLRGKIHVYMGAEDNYYLEGATKLLKKSQEALGSDAVIELFPGLDHSTLLSPGLHNRIEREMAATFKSTAK